MSRLMIYDDTTVRDGWDGFKQDGLAYSWLVGGKLYRIFRSLDKCKGVSSWEEALDWMIGEGKKEPISQIQFWGHGSWGKAWIGKVPLSVHTIDEDDRLSKKWQELKLHLSGDALIWFRTCSTFGNIEGQRFAKRFSEWMGCRVAAHTHLITFWHSGLHSIGPGEVPRWDPMDGVQMVNGTENTVMSSWRTPNTITCLRGSLPKGW